METSHDHECSAEGLYTDQHEIDHEGRCTYRATIFCCGEWWCGDCHETHVDVAHGCWCSGTGEIFYDGILIPCTVCG